MANVRARYFQTCDLCKTEIELPPNGKLPLACLPGWFMPSDPVQKREPMIIELHLCESCMNDVAEYLSGKYDLQNVEYGGIVTRIMRE